MGLYLKIENEKFVWGIIMSVTFKPSDFGLYADIPMPEGCDMILVCVDVHQHTPITILLPHQLYREQLAKIFDEHPGAKSITVIPYKNASKIAITRQDIK
jgi:hypothetical protein